MIIFFSSVAGSVGVAPGPSRSVIPDVAVSVSESVKLSVQLEATAKAPAKAEVQTSTVTNVQANAKVSVGINSLSGGTLVMNLINGCIKNGWRIAMSLLGDPVVSFPKSRVSPTEK